MERDIFETRSRANTVRKRSLGNDEGEEHQQVRDHQKNKMPVAPSNLGLEEKEHSQSMTATQAEQAGTGCFSKFFFGQFNHFFDKEIPENFDIRDLNPLNKMQTTKSVCDQYDKAYFKQYPAGLPNDDVDDSKSSASTITNSSRSAQKHKFLRKGLWKLIRSELFAGCSLKIIERSLRLGIALMMGWFIQELNKPACQVYILLLYILGIAVMFFIAGMAGEHGDYYNSVCVSISGQMLRSLLYIKIKNCNHSFLEFADASLISKLLFFELEIITNFVGQVSEKIASPVIMVFSSILIYTKLGAIAFLLIPIFCLFVFFDFLIIRKQVNQRRVFSGLGNGRALVLLEMVPNMVFVKSNNLEDHFESRLKLLRHKEIDKLKGFHKLQAISNSMYEFLPIVASIIAIGLYGVFNNGEGLGAGAAFSLVSVITLLSNPVRLLGNTIDANLQFTMAIQSFETFYEIVKDKPDNNAALDEFVDLYPPNQRDSKENQPENRFVSRDLFCSASPELVLQNQNEALFPSSRNIYLTRKKTSHLKSFTELAADSRSATNERKKTYNNKEQIDFNGDKKIGLLKFHVKVSKYINRDIIGIKLRDCDFVSPNSSKTKEQYLAIYDVNIGNVMNTSKSEKTKPKSLGRISTISQHRKRRNNNARATTLQLEKLEEQAEEKLLVKNLNFEVFGNKKICLMGNVGSGKTSFLLALCGELRLRSGSRKIKGSVCYINLNERIFFTGTLRDNIILNSEYSVVRYNSVIKAVGLDISVYFGGDMIEVLENGSNLSEVDRQRVVMARALYMNKDIYLIDDYFDKFEMSSMVEHFDSVVLGFLSQRLVIYTSNENIIVKNSDKVIVMKDGEIIEQGKYSELFVNQNSTLFGSIIMSHNARIGGERNAFMKLVEGMDLSNTQKQKLWEKNIYRTIAGLFEQRYKQSRVLAAYNPETMARPRFDFSILFYHAWRLYKRQDEGKILSEDSGSIRNAPKLLINKFMMLNGTFPFAAICTMFLIVGCLYIGLDLWIGLWSTTKLDLSPQNYLIVYMAIAAMICVLLIVRDLYYNHRMLMNANFIHYKLITKLIIASQKWIHNTPTSRIIYRMTKDQQQIDEALITKLLVTIHAFLFVVAGIIILNCFFWGIMGILTFIFGWYIWKLLDKFLEVSQKFMSITVAHKSKMMSLYLQALYGAVHLRVHQNEDYLDAQFSETNDNYQRALSHFNNFSKRWLKVRLAIFNAVFVSACMGTAIIVKLVLQDYFMTEIWQMGLAITWSFKFTTFLNLFILYFTDSLNDVISVSRAYEYIDNCPTEHRDEMEKEKNKRIEKTIQQEEILSRVTRKRAQTSVVGRNITKENKNSILMNNAMSNIYSNTFGIKSSLPEFHSPLRRGVFTKKDGYWPRNFSYAIVMTNLNLHSGKRSLLKHFSFKCEKGESVAVVWNKSDNLLFNLIAGITQPDHQILTNFKSLTTKKIPSIESQKDVKKLFADNSKNTRSKKRVLTEKAGDSSSIMNIRNESGDISPPNRKETPVHSNKLTISEARIRNKFLEIEVPQNKLASFNELGSRVSLEEAGEIKEEVKKLESTKPSNYKAFGKKIDQNTDLSKLRRKIGILYRFPAMFTGTVRSNIDPNFEYDEDEIIRALHFLKILDCMKLKLGEYFEESEINSQNNSSIGMKQTSKRSINISNSNRESTKKPPLNLILETEEENLITLTTNGNENVDSPSNSRKRNRSMSSVQKINPKLAINTRRRERLKSTFQKNNEEENAPSQFMLDIIDPKQIKEVESEFEFSSGAESEKEVEVRETVTPSKHLMFPPLKGKKVQPITHVRIDESNENHKKIDSIKKKKENYNFDDHKIEDMNEIETIKELLEMEVHYMGKNIPDAIKKIFYISKIFLHKPKLILLDEYLLNFNSLKASFFLKAILTTFKGKSAVISLVNNYESILHFDRYTLVSKGTVVEEGVPKEVFLDSELLLAKKISNENKRLYTRIQRKFKRPDQTELLRRIFSPSLDPMKDANEGKVFLVPPNSLSLVERKSLGLKSPIKKSGFSITVSPEIESFQKCQSVSLQSDSSKSLPEIKMEGIEVEAVRESIQNNSSSGSSSDWKTISSDSKPRKDNRAPKLSRLNFNTTKQSLSFDLIEQITKDGQRRNERLGSDSRIEEISKIKKKIEESTTLGKDSFTLSPKQVFVEKASNQEGLDGESWETLEENSI